MTRRRRSSLWIYHGRLFPIDIQYPHFFSGVQPLFDIRRSPRQFFLKQVYMQQGPKKYRILQKDLTSNKANQRVEGISFFPIFRAPLPYSIRILQKQHQYSKNGNILKSGKCSFCESEAEMMFQSAKNKDSKIIFLSFYGKKWLIRKLMIF